MAALSDTELRWQVSARRRDALNDVLWTQLQDDNYVTECLDNPNEPQFVEDLITAIDRYQRVSRALHAGPDTSRAAEEPGPAALGQVSPSPERSGRELAVARIVALEAERDPKVVQFRRRHLSIWERRDSRVVVRLLEPCQIPSWVYAKNAGDVSGLTTVRLSSEGEVLGGDRYSRLTRMLSFVAPPSHHEPLPPRDEWRWHKTYAAAGSPVEELLTLSDRLCEKFNWEPEEATTWILSGAVPGTPSVRWRWEPRTPSAAGRITITIDPTVSPGELADHYRRIRTRILAKPTRRISEKHLALAVFASQRNEERWKDWMERWNELHPAWAYSEWKIFHRDCAAALRRVRDPSFDTWPASLLQSKPATLGVAGPVAPPGRGSRNR